MSTRLLSITIKVIAHSSYLIFIVNFSSLSSNYYVRLNSYPMLVFCYILKNIIIWGLASSYPLYDNSYPLCDSNYPNTLGMIFIKNMISSKD